MSEANGYLVTTAINSDTGEAGSETYKILEVTGEGNQAAYSVRDDEGKLWTIIQRPVGVEDPRVESYRALLRQMVQADEPCPGVGCGFTVLGHLLARVDEPYRDLVKAEDPSQAKP